MTPGIHNWILVAKIWRMSREPVLATADAADAADATEEGAPAPPAGTLDLALDRATEAEAEAAAPAAAELICRNAPIVGEFFFKSDFHSPVSG